MKKKYSITISKKYANDVKNTFGNLSEAQKWL